MHIPQSRAVQLSMSVLFLYHINLTFEQPPAANGYTTQLLYFRSEFENFINVLSLFALLTTNIETQSISSCVRDDGMSLVKCIPLSL